MTRVLPLYLATILVLACGIDSMVRVEVVDDAGRPIAHAAVVIDRVDGAPKGPPPALTDASGQDERELVPGSYRVRVSARGFEPAEQQFFVIGGVPVLVRVTLRRAAL
ncbi:MAG TPA: carboxypeptidase-like regulatory domain-containing protein [Candidatus Limnocylindrales bacterium]|nr:carboxypeptidase-like regulatory domain-containing protein [Candidatus Limnocylindrales bacterium]